MSLKKKKTSDCNSRALSLIKAPTKNIDTKCENIDEICKNIDALCKNIDATLKMSMHLCAKGMNT